MHPFVADHAARIAERAADDVRALVDIPSGTGDRAGGDASIAALVDQLPRGGELTRPPSSTPGHPDDLLVRWPGTGSGRLLLLGHIDTVIGPEGHSDLEEHGPLLQGTGTYDMKGGLVLAAGVARALCDRPDAFERIDLLCVADEEWRRQPLRYGPDTLDHDACLCFEGGERRPEGEAIVVRRRGAALLEVVARGRAAHAGAAAASGRSALLAVAGLAGSLAAHSDPASELDVIPTMLASGEAMNRIPDHGTLGCDLRAFDGAAFEHVRASIPEHVDGVALTAGLRERFPPMDTAAAATPLLAAGERLLGRPLTAVARGGASDAAYVARHVPITVDGLGPLGGEDHSPGEHVVADSFGPRAQVALAVALAALG